MSADFHEHDPAFLLNLIKRPLVAGNIDAPPVGISGFYRMVVEQTMKRLALK